MNNSPQISSFFSLFQNFQELDSNSSRGSNSSDSGSDSDGSISSTSDDHVSDTSHKSNISNKIQQRVSTPQAVTSTTNDVSLNQSKSTNSSTSSGDSTSSSDATSNDEQDSGDSASNHPSPESSFNNNQNAIKSSEDDDDDDEEETRTEEQHNDDATSFKSSPDVSGFLFFLFAFFGIPFSDFGSDVLLFCWIWVSNWTFEFSVSVCLGWWRIPGEKTKSTSEATARQKTAPTQAQKEVWVLLTMFEIFAFLVSSKPKKTKRFPISQFPTIKIVGLGIRRHRRRVTLAKVTVMPNRNRIHGPNERWSFEKNRQLNEKETRNRDTHRMKVIRMSVSGKSKSEKSKTNSESDEREANAIMKPVL